MSNESREIFFRPSGEFGSTFKVKIWSPSARLVNSPINTPFSVAPEVQKSRLGISFPSSVTSALPRATVFSPQIRIPVPENGIRAIASESKLSSALISAYFSVDAQSSASVQSLKAEPYWMRESRSSIFSTVSPCPGKTLKQSKEIFERSLPRPLCSRLTVMVIR